MAKLLADRWEGLLRRAEARLPALTRLKTPEALPATLDRRRIYVLPTRFGLFFGLMLSAMTLGGLNYNNNPALILCFLLASAAHTGLLVAYLGLRGLRLQDVSADPVHAGQPVALRFRFDAQETRWRRGLVLRLGATQRAFDLGPGEHADVALEVPSAQRGWLAVGRVELSIRRPLGMFVAWSWLHPQRRVLVYPALEANPPPLPGSGTQGRPRRQRGPEEELHALRDYRGGDPLRSVAWKRSAQMGRMLVREFETPSGHDAVLDWDALVGLGPEARIRRLARWVVDAERGGRRSELRIPGERLGPARGPAHLHACLRALALLDVAGAQR